MDAMAIAQFTNGLVLVLEAGGTRRETALAATAIVRSTGVPILGAVLNKRTFPIPQPLYDRM
jgi:Mrp family chromosome partitioning ATPase